MSRFGFESVCKDCGKVFQATSAGYLSGAVLGNGAASRCEEHRKAYKVRMQKYGLGYFKVPAPAVESSSEVGGEEHQALNKSLPKTEQKSFLGVPPEDTAAFFAYAEPAMKSLVEDLLNPDSPRFYLVRVRTGWGKSVLMPYYLLNSELSRQGTIWVTEPRLEVIRPKEIGGDGVIPSYIGKTLMQAPAPGYGKGFEIGVRYKDDNQAMYDAENNRLVFCSDGLMLRMLLNGGLAGVRVLVIDEAHEMSENMSTLFSLLKLVIHLYPDLKVVFASATVNPQDWIEFYAPMEVKVISPEGAAAAPKHETFVNWPSSEDSQYEGLANRSETFGYADKLPGFKEVAEAGDIPGAATMIVKGIREGVIGNMGKPFGSCLVFVPTQAPLAATAQALRDLQLPGLEVFVAYADASAKERADFVRSEELILAGTWPTNKQRVVVATNTLETGVTYRFDYVIEPGLLLQKRWVTSVASYQFVVGSASRDKMLQRWGRVGRVACGEAFPCYSKKTFLEQPEFSPPTLANSRLDGVILSLLRSGLANLHELHIFGARLEDAGVKAEYDRAVKQLVVNQAITREGLITDNGMLLEGSGAGVVNLGAMMMKGEDAGFAAEIATFIAFLGLAGGTRLFSNDDKGLLAHYRFSADCLDDLEFYLKLYLFWKSSGENQENEGKNSGRRGQKLRADVMVREGLIDRTLQVVESNQQALLKEFERGSHETQALREFDPKRIHRLRAVIARATREWIYYRSPKTGEFLPAFPKECPYDGAILIDRESACSNIDDIQVFVCVDRELRNGVVYAKHIVRVEREWLPVIASMDDGMLLMAVKKTLATDNAYTTGVAERLLTPPLPVPDVRSFSVGERYSFKIVRKQPSRSGDGTWALVQIEGSAAVVAARFSGYCSIETGVVARANVKAVNAAEGLIELTQLQIKQELVAAKQLVEAKVIERLIDREDATKVSGLVVEIEPGIRGSLYANKLDAFASAVEHIPLGSVVPVYPAGINDASERLSLSAGKEIDLCNNKAIVKATILAQMHRVGDAVSENGILLGVGNNGCPSSLVPVFVQNSYTGYLVIGYISTERGKLYTAVIVDVPPALNAVMALMPLTRHAASPLVFQAAVPGGPRDLVNRQADARGVTDGFEYDDNGERRHVLVKLDNGYTGTIAAKHLGSFGSELDNCVLTRRISGFHVSEQYQGKLVLKPMTPYWLEPGILVSCVVSKVISREPGRELIKFELAPGVYGVMGNHLGAGQFLGEFDIQEGSCWVVAVTAKGEHKGKPSYTLGVPYALSTPQSGEVYAGRIISDYDQKLNGWKVAFCPGSRTGLLRWDSNTMNSNHLYSGAELNVAVLSVENDRYGNPCFNLGLARNDLEPIRVTCYPEDASVKRWSI
jgi:hypothetical protein